jgi:hypothetical protein
MFAVYGDAASSKQHTKYLSTQFKRGRKSIKDDPHHQRPVEVTKSSRPGYAGHKSEGVHNCMRMKCVGTICFGHLP